MNEDAFLNDVEKHYSNSGKIASLLSERRATTRKEILARAKNDCRSLGERDSEPSGELLEMIIGLLDFAETGRDITDWKAARLALASYKRNL